ncbi:Bax inhibitor-1/YccA family protein [Nocardioides panacis]|uniref:Bax inhibitor-1/YccA family protein n=1 Tax=Nocardioides panacis TaxID=2849501 RepID=A0A975SYM7_9ACTN|nr:Bax inhibitor-1/YccA family protein [Nocardioides panacis]QWZ08398.1 Bax inhibitor-1/YccA family protein [Nocardioides panacis]
MQSSNPVFRRSEGFNGKSTTSGMSYPAYGTQTRTDPYGGGRQDAPVYTGPSTDARMTIDSVVQKSGITLGLVVLVAAATWFLTPAPGSLDAGVLYLLLMVGAFGGFALSMVNSFKRVISPGLVIAYAVLEGLFVGAFSKVIDGSFGDGEHGIVVGAVAGTFAAVAGTLAAYKFFNIRVTPTFRKWVVGAMLGFVAVALLDVVLGLFGSSFGFNGFGPMGLLSSVIGLGLGVLMLILDFDFVERGIEAGLPERESWRAAFGLTVTIIWIYVELLRILAILRGD